MVQILHGCNAKETSGQGDNAAGTLTTTSRSWLAVLLESLGALAGDSCVRSGCSEFGRLRAGGSVDDSAAAGIDGRPLYCAVDGSGDCAAGDCVFQLSPD